MSTDHDLFAPSGPVDALRGLIDSGCFDEQGRRIRIPDLGVLDVFCDHEGCSARIVQPWMIIANVTEFQRVSRTSHWAFCSAEHRTAWWAAGQDWDFFPVSIDPMEFREDDRGLQLNVIHYDGPGVHDQMMALRNPETGATICRTPGELVLCVILGTPADLNRWWSMADTIALPSGVEILYSKAA